jgi:putative transposase
MPRRKRGWIDNACYHITHRCHERKFLFKFSKYRDIYIKQLFEAKQRFGIDVLDYIVTSNHVHLLVTSKKAEEISRALQFLHGSVGQKYNILKNREGSFWKDRFHSTCIQSGGHLSKCLFYIDMNMVRAGVVKHPSFWKHSGYHEIMGERQRYRIINKERLLQALSMDDIERMRRWYRLTLEHLLRAGELAREEYWSKAIAVGDPEWLKNITISMDLKRYKIQNADSTNTESGYFIGKD